MAFSPFIFGTGGGSGASAGWELVQTIDLTGVADATYTNADLSGKTVTNNGIVLGGQVMGLGVGLEAVSGSGIRITGGNLGIFSVGPAIDLSAGNLWAIVGDVVSADSVLRSVMVGLGTSRTTEADQVRAGRIKNTGSGAALACDSFDGTFLRSDLTRTLSGPLDHVCAVVHDSGAIGYVSIEADGLPSAPSPADFLASRSCPGRGDGGCNILGGDAYATIHGDDSDAQVIWSGFRVYRIRAAS